MALLHGHCNQVAGMMHCFRKSPCYRWAAIQMVTSEPSVGVLDVERLCHCCLLKLEVI